MHPKLVLRKLKMVSVMGKGFHILLMCLGVSANTFSEMADFNPFSAT